MQHWSGLLQNCSPHYDVIYYKTTKSPVGLRACLVNCAGDSDPQSRHSSLVQFALRFPLLYDSGLHCHSQCACETAPALCPCSISGKEVRAIMTAFQISLKGCKEGFCLVAHHMEGRREFWRTYVRSRKRKILRIII